MSKMFVKSGDTVVVLSGKSKGVKGEVVAVSPAEGKVIVKKVNVVTKHVKPKKMGEPGPGGGRERKKSCGGSRFMQT